MKKITLNPSHFYTRRDVGGPIGLLLDTAFCSLLILVALGMAAFAFLILIVNYVVSPLLALLNKLRYDRTM
jgi:hypothetical protein